MTLELTKTEYLRLRKHMEISEKQRNSNTNKTKPSKEAEILAAVQADISSHEIQRMFKVCNKTVVNIKKRNGLWGV